MIEIDGAQGEGGGQVLRSALSLAMVTGRPLRICNIRAGRKRPGLMRQHLTALRAAQTVSDAKVSGAELGSGELVFEPVHVRGGDYAFAVGTAGSATLVAQTVLPALMLAGRPSKVRFEGGTHNPYAPPFDFLERCFLPLLRRMGVGVEAQLNRPGFYPAGGGRFALEIAPAERLTPLELMARGARKSARAEAVIANLPRDIAERELKVIAGRLGWPEAALLLREETRSPGPGNVVMLTLEFEQVTELFTGFGAVGVSAEAVATRALQDLQRYVKRDAAVGPHLADQLLLLMALAGAGRFTTVKPSPHTRTNIEVIRRFLPVEIGCRERDTGVWQIDVTGH